MRITINLATRPYTDVGPALKQLRMAMALLAVLAAALGFSLRTLHVDAEAARLRERAADANLQRLQQEQASYQQRMKEPQNAELLGHIAVLNQLIDEKSFSWTLAMEDLETVLPAGVQATTLEPLRDAKTGSITLRLRVAGPRDKAVELVRNIERSKHFAEPRIVGENSESSGGANERLEPISASSRVNFDLLALYKPSYEPRPQRKSATVEAPAAVVSMPTPVPNRAGAPRPPQPNMQPMQRPPFARPPQPNAMQQRPYGFPQNSPNMPLDPRGNAWTHPRNMPNQPPTPEEEQ